MQQRPLPAPAVSPVYMSTTIIIVIVTCIHESPIETVTRAGHAVADFVGTAYFNSDHSPAPSCSPLLSYEGRGGQGRVA